jgi:3-dehydroquinate synthase
MNEKNISIQSGSKNYSVFFVPHSTDLIDQLRELKNTLVFVDQQVEGIYADLIQKLRQFTSVYAIEASEDNKTLAGAEVVLKKLQDQAATKSTTIVAIGGGIIQDIVSFAAHIYHRGLSFVFVPTTLLAMCDSCIGGKCGLNYNGYKNQLGAFHPPEKVIIWPDFVRSLPSDAIYSGYGEIFKLMLIGHAELYQDIKRTLMQEGFNNSKFLDHIHQALLVKKQFIEEDEFDNGVRRILNYGHTLGHALELATNYEVPHGIAVVRGLDIANYIAYQKGLLPEDIYLNIHDFIEGYFHCDIKPSVTAELLIANAQKDKKVTHGQINMIFMEDYGKFKIAPVLLEKEINDIVHSYLKSNRILYSE